MLSPSELKRIVWELDVAGRADKPAALATVVSISGSAYRRPGARLFVREDGVVAGGVSGGCLEADVVKKARAAIQEGRPTLVAYDATDDHDGGFGQDPGGRGEIHILIEPVGLERTALHVACLRAMLTARKPRVLALRFAGPTGDVGAIAMFSSDGAWIGGDRAHLLPGIEDCVSGVLQQRRAEEVDQGDAVASSERLLLDYLVPIPHLLVVGAGPDSEPLAACASAVGYRVMIVDERPGSLGARQFPPGTRTSKAPLHELVPAEVDAFTACIVATHNAAYDGRALTQLLASRARYIGVLGPRRRTARLLEHILRTTGGAAGDGSRLFAPAGLDIGADTPDQIALAVLAEIQAVFAGRPGGYLRNRAAPIHGDGIEHASAEGVAAH